MMKPIDGETHPKAPFCRLVAIVGTLALLAVAAVVSANHSSPFSRTQLGKTEDVRLAQDDECQTTLLGNLQSMMNQHEPMNPRVSPDLQSVSPVVVNGMTYTKTIAPGNRIEIRITNIPNNAVGSLTNQAVRNAIQVEAATPPGAPKHVVMVVKVSINAGFQCLVWIAPNPEPYPGRRWHAGHILARQNGGTGVNMANLFAQSPQVNCGNNYNGAPTFHLWRAHENQMRQTMNLPGVGLTQILAVFDYNGLFPTNLVGWAPNAADVAHWNNYCQMNANL